MKKTDKKAPKYVTMSVFEKAMASIAKSFSGINEKLAQHDNAFVLILKEIRAIHNDNKEFRKSISGLTIDGLSYDRKIENLNLRVEKLESKVK